MILSFYNKTVNSLCVFLFVVFLRWFPRFSIILKASRPENLPKPLKTNENPQIYDVFMVFARFSMILSLQSRKSKKTITKTSQKT